MAAPSPPPSFSPGVKRTYDGTPVALATQLNTNITLQPTTNDAEPPLSLPSSPLSELTAATPHPPSSMQRAASPSKKPKLTFAEQQIENAINKVLKEERAKAKEEEKRVKDEEKRKKAEEKEAAKRQKEIEKAHKDAEKEQKKLVRDQEKALKEAEKQLKESEKARKEAEKQAEKDRKEAEKLKKEKSQMRLTALFGRPAAAATPPATPDEATEAVLSRCSSVAPMDLDKPEVDSPAPKTTNGFSKWILPFFVSEHTELAPTNRFLSGMATSDLAWLDRRSDEMDMNPQLRFSTRNARIPYTVPVKDLMAAATGTASTPIDLTSENAETTAALRKARYKILRFREDVRPPYKGTWTRNVSPRTARKVSRRPTYRGLPEVDYDYDSEAEWQEPEADDEDLEDEDDLSEEEDAADEMEDFLDDEADTGKRAVTSSDVEPVSTGLCWEGFTEMYISGVDLATYRMQRMSDDQVLPIDPYSTNHWTGPTKAEKKAIENATETAMQPPRLPLANVSVNSSPMRAFVSGSKDVSGPKQKENAVPQSAPRGRPRNPDKPVKTIPDEVLPDFKRAVEGSDLNKIALVEILKKQFPKCSKEAIKGTLDTIAMRQGVKEADKRWVLIA